MSLARTLVDSFFDGFGPGGLFVRLRRPGRSRAVFAPEGSKDGSRTLERARAAAEMLPRRREGGVPADPVAQGVLQRGIKG